MTDVVKRLRASKDEVGCKSYEAGFETGKKWAEVNADAKQLQNLEQLWDSCSTSHEWELQFDGESNSVYSAAERLAFEINPEMDGERNEAAGFWEIAVGDDAVAESNLADDEFMRGFAEGALDVWGEVKGKV
ncbi:MAG: hypothetical protein AB7O68_17400 [Pirellulales bacterium]